MRDTEVRLTSIYVAPHGSTVSSPSPNSEDAPAGSFDLIITGEEGDDIQQNNTSYNLFYYAVDFFTGNPASAGFNTPVGGIPQTTGGAVWIGRGAGPNFEDFFTSQSFTITGLGGLTGHVLQYFAVLVAVRGDIVSFVQSEPFVLV